MSKKKVCGNFLVICEKHYNFAENSRKKRKKMSQIWLNMALALASWAGLLFFLVEIIADHVEDKHGDTKIFDFRRKRKE